MFLGVHSSGFCCIFLLKDCGLEHYPEYAESIAGDLVEASIRSNEKQRLEIKKKVV